MQLIPDNINSILIDFATSKTLYARLYENETPLKQYGDSESWYILTYLRTRDDWYFCKDAGMWVKVESYE